jgi:hypothetical protein
MFVQSDPGPGLFMYISASAWIISIYSSLGVGLGGIPSSLSEPDDPHNSRLLALLSACLARSRARSRCALSASTRSSTRFSIALVIRRQVWHTGNSVQDPCSELTTLQAYNKRFPFNDDIITRCVSIGAWLRVDTTVHTPSFLCFRSPLVLFPFHHVVCEFCSGA